MSGYELFQPPHELYIYIYMGGGESDQNAILLTQRNRCTDRGKEIKYVSGIYWGRI